MYSPWMSAETSHLKIMCAKILRMDDIGAILVYPSWEEEGAKQKSCPLVDQGSMGRDTQTHGHQILQDLGWHSG